ncbi:Rqc2 family fibronectin-binding protein [Nitrospira sp. Kam-Ns4a]
MALSMTELEAVLREVAPVLTGGWIQKIRQPAPKTVALDIRAAGKTVTLLLSADPDTARIHLASERDANPPILPPFCQRLRAHLKGARIEGIEPIGADRVVRLRMRARKGACSLVAALTGRSADVLLLDASDRVLASLVEGQAKTGTTWHPPTGRPHTESDTPPAPVPVLEDNRPFPISRLIERREREREDALAGERLRQARLVELRKAIKKAARRVEALQADLEKAARYRDYERYGELLKANLGRIERGQDAVTVVDYFDPSLPELVIPLDPAKGPQANMEEYFRKHRKHISAEREIRPRLLAAEQELERLRAELTAIQQGDWIPPVPRPASQREGRARPLTLDPSPLTHRPARSGPFRRFTSADGLPIYVGRSARENEELTFRFAHSDDLWLHARGGPGSHVVVRLAKGAEPPPETLREAATLALLYSDLKKSGNGEVIYTRRKWVKKLKGQPPGTVAVTQDKTLFVELDRARLERLKARRPPS